jgi:hypothetical protein
MLRASCIYRKIDLLNGSKYDSCLVEMAVANSGKEVLTNKKATKHQVAARSFVVIGETENCFPKTIVCRASNTQEFQASSNSLQLFKLLLQRKPFPQVLPHL